MLGFSRYTFQGQISFGHWFVTHCITFIRLLLSQLILVSKTSVAFSLSSLPAPAFGYFLKKSKTCVSISNVLFYMIVWFNGKLK